MMTIATATARRFPQRKPWMASQVVVWMLGQ